MNFKKLLYTVTLLLSYNLYAPNEEHLLQSFLNESAVTSQQREALRRYYTNLAQQKKEQYENYLEVATTRRGGKSNTQDTQRLQYLKKAQEAHAAYETYVKLSGGL